MKKMIAVIATLILVLVTAAYAETVEIIEQPAAEAPAEQA